MRTAFKATTIRLRVGECGVCPHGEDGYSVCPTACAASVSHLHVYRRVVQYLHAVSYPLSASHAGLQVLWVTSRARQQQVRPVVWTIIGAVERKLRHIVQDVLCRDEGEGRSSAGEQICMQAAWLVVCTVIESPGCQ